MQNMFKIYKGHNSKITSTPRNQLILCNCQAKGECPMDGVRRMPNYVRSLLLLCHVTRTAKNLPWVGRKKMEEKVS